MGEKKDSDEKEDGDNNDSVFRSCIFCRELFVKGQGFKSHLVRKHGNLIPELKKRFGIPSKHGRWNEL